MKVTMIPTVIGALTIIPRGFVNGLEVLEIRGRAKTTQTSSLLRSARIPRMLNTDKDDFDLSCKFGGWQIMMFNYILR